MISQSRRLVRDGPVTELRDFSLKDKEEERNVYMHLFNELSPGLFAERVRLAFFNIHT